MRTLKNIIESNNEPKTDNIWLKNGDLKHFKNGKWESLIKIDDIETNIKDIQDNYIKRIQTGDNYLLQGINNDGIFYSSSIENRDPVIYNQNSCFEFANNLVTFNNSYFRVGDLGSISFMTDDAIGTFNRDSMVSLLNLLGLYFYNAGTLFKIDRIGEHKDGSFALTQYKYNAHHEEEIDWQISQEGVNLGGNGNVLLDNGKTIPLSSSKYKGNIEGVAVLSEYGQIPSELIEEASLSHRGTVKKIPKIADLASSATTADCVAKINELLDAMRNVGMLQANS